MTWLNGTEDRDYTIDAPLEEVADFLADPDCFHECVQDVESVERVDDDTWRWTLEEMSAKGVSFQGEYTVQYEREDEVVRWETVGDGNMTSEGEARLEAVDGGRTRVRYEETIGVEISIPSLMGSVLEPIVSREIRKGVNHFLDCTQRRLESGTT